MKQIDIHGGNYRIYADGRIWSYKTKRFMKVSIDPDGYPRVTLSRDGKIKNQTLHRWLYLAFIGDIPKGMQINHIDGDKLNNSLSNLELVTPKRNTQHAWGIGLCRKQFGSSNAHSKLTETDIPKIFQMYENGFTQGEIAALFGIDQSNVSKIIHKNTWLHAA